jgi:hypothetical protein
VFYESAALSSAPSWADPPLTQLKKARQSLPFNTYDRVHKVDRCSYDQDYALHDGFPRCACVCVCVCVCVCAALVASLD